jgi:hypothetical protein
MQFHEYINLRNQMTKFGHNEFVRKSAKTMTPEQFRRFVLKACDDDMSRASPGRESNEILERTISVGAEQAWVDGDRPYYNVWPVAESLAREVRLDLPFSAVEIPFNSILLRFARGYEPFNITTAMLFFPKGWAETTPSINLTCYFPETMDRLMFRYDFDPSEVVENWLQGITEYRNSETWQPTERAHQNANTSAASLMVRLAVFIGLLSNDQDLITPVVLAKDRDRYESADDTQIKKWLEDRAARRLGRGYDFGKKLQVEKDSSPHWRNPHLALFWTGKGRLKPVIKMRRGAVVQRVSMSEVPTGFIGPETDADNQIPEAVFERVAISASKRFEIFKRDSYRCRLCGRSSEDGAALHVDHQKPVAKGGTNDDDNLWTLCDRCNLGKSDCDL